MSRKCIKVSRARPIYCIHMEAIQTHSVNFHLHPQGGSVVTVIARAIMAEAWLWQWTAPIFTANFLTTAYLFISNTFSHSIVHCMFLQHLGLRLGCSTVPLRNVVLMMAITLPALGQEHATSDLSLVWHSGFTACLGFTFPSAACLSLCVFVSVQMCVAVCMCAHECVFIYCVMCSVFYAQWTGCATAVCLSREPTAVLNPAGH